jgi:hypothetical protein
MGLAREKHMADEKKSNLFSAYKVVMQNGPQLSDSLQAYLIESTAPDNIDDDIDDNINNNIKYRDKLIPLEVDADGGVIDEIVDRLSNSNNPTLVISVHGFNNPRNVLLEPDSKATIARVAGQRSGCRPV